ncbi:MAG: HD domain-containing protein [Lachnospiraceae bacterium]|nr:HD domain-containing protein [Lachnospiraceae bacterium]
MKKISVKDLQGGEILAKDVYTVEFQVLIAKGTVLKEEYIDKLPLLNIEFVYIEDGKEPEEPKEQEFNMMAQEMVGKVKFALEHHIYKNNKELKNICTMTEDLIESVLMEKEASTYMIEMKEEKNDMITHSLHVCSFATMLAFRLGMDKAFAIDIAKGGLLHDIGLRYLTVPYENCDIDRLSSQEQKEYRKHTTNGYMSLGQEGWLTERAKKIVLLHHEYENGSGYPIHLTSERIPDAVKIISICDVFDEMISGIGFCHRKVQEAIEFLKYNSGRLFYKNYTDVFLSMIVCYPIGSIVRLSNGDVGKVIRQNPKFNERPVVELLCDANGKKYGKKKIIDLCKTLNVFITYEEDSME